MNCPRCNAEITENGKFCTFCGAPLEEHNTDVGQQPVAPIGNQKYKMAVHVDLGEAIKRLFTNCFAFDGRASRSEYWWSYLFMLILSPLVLIPFIGGVLMIVLFFPMISCGVRRLHDAGYSGMYYLFILIPFVGVAVLLVFLAQKSVPDNQWGLAAR